jgi:long-chain acyl-CoA synthetase
MLLNLFEIVERAAERWPKSVALVQEERAFTYQDLHAAACKLADELLGIGVTRGDRVGVVFPRSIEYVLACFAVLKAGAIAVPISAALKAHEIAAAITAVDIDAFCCHENLRSTMAASGISGTNLLDRPPSHSPLAVARIPAPRQNPLMRERLIAANTAYICFSSGTTSVSKGIVLSHQALYERANRRLDAPKTTPESCLLWLRAFDRFVPNQIVAAFLLGAKVVVGNSLDRRSLPGLIKKHGVDQVWAVPPFYKTLLQNSVPAMDYDSVAYFLSSGAPLPAQVSQGFCEKFGREIMQNYGSAECSPIFINSSAASNKRGSVGRPVEGREVRLRSLDSNTDEGAGELLVRGSGMLSAYYNPWSYPEEFLEDGWLPTGDIARRDEDGYYWIIGRIKEIINVGGTKVFAREVEEILSGHTGVEDCVVFGVTDQRFGEVPHAKVKLRAGAVLSEIDLLRWVNDRVSVFKSLRKLELVDHIEKTATGKTKRWIYRALTLPAPLFEIISATIESALTG